MSHVSKLKKYKKDKKKKKESQKAKMKEERNEREKEREREREGGGSKKFHLSLRSKVIELSVFIGARRKVDPRIISYAWVPKSWNFVKLHEVGNFPIWD